MRSRLQPTGLGEVFSGLNHGFGLGTRTKAEGWIENAVSFWEKQMK